MQRSSEEYLNQFTRQLQQAIDVHGSVKGQSDAHSRVRGHSMRDINGSGREQPTTTVTSPHTSTRFPDVHQIQGFADRQILMNHYLAYPITTIIAT